MLFFFQKCFFLQKMFFFSKNVFLDVFQFFCELIRSADLISKSADLSDQLILFDQYTWSDQLIWLEQLKTDKKAKCYRPTNKFKQTKLKKWVGWIDYSRDEMYYHAKLPALFWLWLHPPPPPVTSSIIELHNSHQFILSSVWCDILSFIYPYQMLAATSS